jgi:hypothetical protein
VNTLNIREVKEYTVLNALLVMTQILEELVLEKISIANQLNSLYITMNIYSFVELALLDAEVVTIILSTSVQLCMNLFFVISLHVIMVGVIMNTLADVIRIVLLASIMIHGQ